jgi:hypothetical protein
MSRILLLAKAWSYLVPALTSPSVAVTSSAQDGSTVPKTDSMPRLALVLCRGEEPLQAPRNVRLTAVSTGCPHLVIKQVKNFWKSLLPFIFRAFNFLVYNKIRDFEKSFAIQF